MLLSMTPKEIAVLFVKDPSFKIIPVYLFTRFSSLFYCLHPVQINYQGIKAHSMIFFKNILQQVLSELYTFLLFVDKLLK